MTSASSRYPARLDIDRPDELDRLTTFFRLIWVIPALILLTVLTANGAETVSVISDTGEVISRTTESGAGIAGGLAAATMLMIVFRQRYPRWWFDFARELTRFTGRVLAYLFLMTDRYPSTVEEQTVHLEIDYPDVEQDLNRWLPLVKWLLALPHYIVLAVLWAVAIVVWIMAWFAIVFTGRFPRSLFDYLEGVGRWSLRVDAYAFLLVTDEYPPFSLS